MFILDNDLLLDQLSAEEKVKLIDYCLIDPNQSSIMNSSGISHGTIVCKVIAATS